MKNNVEPDIKAFFENQIKVWELARTNFEALSFIKKRTFCCGSLLGHIQFNPARAVSTLAKVDKVSIDQRKCFLCDHNRPEEQKSFEILPDWQLLVNPFPILPYHFTIVNSQHLPQKLEFETGINLAKKLDGFVVFFNDDGAGASAPDHMHFQAVPLEYLPLIKLLSSKWDSIQELQLPFQIFLDEEEIKGSKDPMNVYFWKDMKAGGVKFMAIPRKAHRPKEYFLSPPERRAISPGAIDMAGVMVTPIKEDFYRVDDKDVENIYRQVGYDA
ncbi:MAG: DUF4922 domain-containing protein [Muribaculaceae bacterium]|nr:DUF4922 domain-containing protein [Muribaculaceae bacterium]